ncbi:MAG: F0F1 ATP synthase subunit B [Candidatus Omnitrophica bacterium]|nr:F0F1 ATP synthase subunit B [Candidatus Omnitrophota bacterium]
MVDISLTMVMQWLNFGVLLVVLYIILYKPLVKFLDARSQQIQNDLDSAQKNKEESETLVSKYEAKIKSVEKEADEFMDNIKRDALIEKNKILKSAQDEADAIMIRTKKELEAEVANAKNELKKQFSSYAVLCAQQIMQKEVSEDDHKELVKKFLESEL